MLSLFSERDTWPKLPDDVYRAVSGRYLWTELRTLEMAQSTAKSCRLGPKVEWTAHGPLLPRTCQAEDESHQCIT